VTASSPTVTVITATYNRSNVLRYAIASLLRSTYTDWELLVIGDACTDDSEEVVASFDDPRIQFINLQQNLGEQTGPNNEGLRRARGRYIAFLNHDDLWFPDHLAVAVEGIEKSGADLVYTLAIAIVGEQSFLSGSTQSGRYEPQMRVPATQWLLRRELVEAIGPWRFSRQIYTIPSQDWLYRARQAHKQLRLIPKITVLVLPSHSRPNVYLERDYLTNQHYFEQMENNPLLLEQLLTQIACTYSAELSALAILPTFRRLVRNLVYSLGLKLNLSPDTIKYFVLFRRKGGLMIYLRKFRGLPPRG
jgi:glycosyltransferase involved in cell wall biosynthesis